MNNEIRKGAPNSERRLSRFDIERRRFGAWGMVKGNLLRQFVGEKKAYQMFRNVKKKEDLYLLRDIINNLILGDLFLEEMERGSTIKEELGINQRVEVKRNGFVIIYGIGYKLFSQYPDPDWNQWGGDPSGWNEYDAFFD